ncbi:hypothetical protein D9M68_938700 [compost metagenome]
MKKRMITCGRPAVPIISDSAYMNMFSLLPGSAVVYSPKPRSVTTWSSLASSVLSVPRKSPPRPSCGIALPVSASEMNTAGTV